MTAHSPCIDAGDPNSLHDPDNTITDLGAYYFDLSLGVEEHPFGLKPLAFSLYSPYPNPFNASTTISFNLPSPANVTMKIYDITGREVQSLHSGRLSAGNHRLEWNSQGAASSIYFAVLETEGMPSGVYFVWLSADGGQPMMRKMVYMK